jgi:hypothetical protein
MTPEQVREILRDKNLCGRLDIELNQVCVLELKHDDGMHETRWAMRNEVSPDPNSSRDSITRFVVTDGHFRFEAATPAQATWLLSVLLKFET